MNEEFWNAIDKLVAESEIVIDRPTGSSHPRYPHFVYEVAYGYLKNTQSYIYNFHNESQYMKGILIRR